MFSCISLWWKIGLLLTYFTSSCVFLQIMLQSSLYYLQVKQFPKHITRILKFTNYNLQYFKNLWFFIRTEWTRYIVGFSCFGWTLHIQSYSFSKMHRKLYLSSARWILLKLLRINQGTYIWCKWRVRYTFNLGVALPSDVITGSWTTKQKSFKEPSPLPRL